MVSFITWYKIKNHSLCHVIVFKSLAYDHHIIRRRRVSLTRDGYCQKYLVLILIFKKIFQRFS